MESTTRTDQLLQIGSPDYHKALRQESDYWGEEIKKATRFGIPFSADMRRAQKIAVNRGNGLPQQQTFDPHAERIMNGPLYNRIFKTVSRAERANVLVLTCGPGNLCLELARFGHDVLGMDISEGAIEIARKYARENPFTENFGSLEYKVADLNVIEFEPESFDFVVAWDGLHHILELDRLLQQVEQALKPNGKFLFSDNIGMHWKSRLFGGALYFLLPTHLSYKSKFKYAFGGARKVKEEMAKRSPFEEVNTDTILDLATNYFQIFEKSFHTGVGFRAAIAGDVRFPPSVKYPFLRRLKRMDDWMVQNNWLNGDHVFVVAGPRKTKTGAASA